MSAKRDRKSIVDFFAREIQSAMTELDATIYTNIQRIASEYSSRGILLSGMTVSAMLKMINDNVLLSCKDNLEFITLFQDENHLRFKDDQLGIICDLYSSKYISYYLDGVKQSYFGIGKRYIGDDSLSVVLTQHDINMTNAIINMVINKTNDIKTLNLVGKEDPSVKTTKVNIWVTIFSAFLAVLGTVATIYFTVFYHK